MWVMSPNLRINLDKMLKSDLRGGKGQISAGKKNKRRENLQLPSTIYKARLLGFRQAKNESSSTQRELRVGTESTRFLRGFKRGVREIKGFGFRKCPRDFLEFLLRSKR